MIDHIFSVCGAAIIQTRDRCREGVKLFVNLLSWREVGPDVFGTQHCFEQKVLAEVPFFNMHYAISLYELLYS